MRTLLTLICIIVFNFSTLSQDVKETELKNQTQLQIYKYAYITIEGKSFSKKLKVEVDFGETPEQIKVGKEYSEILTNKKSYAAVLNYMAENHFELAETRDSDYTYKGTGGTSGIVFIMRKKI